MQKLLLAGARLETNGDSHDIYTTQLQPTLIDLDLLWSPRPT